jgi:hypothetical protein
VFYVESDVPPVQFLAEEPKGTLLSSRILVQVLKYGLNKKYTDNRKNRISNTSCIGTMLL